MYEAIEKLLDVADAIKVSLNKQGLQWNGKEIVNIKPKFKVGDWIVGANNVFKIISLNNELNCYIAITPNNEEVKIPYYFDDGPGHMCSYHLWTIQDAKAGDVLVCPKYIGDMPYIFIFKNIKRKDNDVFCYCSFFKIFMTGSYVASADPTDTDFYPATNEQRILLFVKMKEAGICGSLIKGNLSSYCLKKEILSEKS